jgi:sugar (pentulose or hexulose) kinase
MEILEDLGFKIHEMRAIGGAVRSQLWMQIQADILNKDILLVNHEEGGVLGAAILAGTGVGIFKDPINAIENIVKVTKRIKPRHESHEKYIKLYNVYRKLYYGIHDYYDLLAENSGNI